MVIDMDLYAYAQIGELEEIAKRNGIEVPRLRGYRLMENEKPVARSEIDQMKKEAEVDAAKELCKAKPFWSPRPQFWESSARTRALLDFYLTRDKEHDNSPSTWSTEYIGIRWDRIHGKKRRILKFEIKKKKRVIQRQYDLWNKYAGQKGVLYIHSKSGSHAWAGHENLPELREAPWFLGYADDWQDPVYCDYYARIEGYGD